MWWEREKEGRKTTRGKEWRGRRTIRGFRDAVYPLTREIPPYFVPLCRSPPRIHTHGLKTEILPLSSPLSVPFAWRSCDARRSWGCCAVSGPYIYHVTPNFLRYSLLPLPALTSRYANPKCNLTKGGQTVRSKGLGSIPTLFRWKFLIKIRVIHRMISMCGLLVRKDNVRFSSFCFFFFFVSN